MIEPTSTQAEPQTVQPVASGEPPAAKPPETQPDEKAKILSRARARAGVSAPARETPPTSATATESAPAKPAEPAQTNGAAADPDEESARRLALLVREDRRIKTEQKKLESERSSHADEMAILRSVREAKSKGDRVAMLKAMFPGEDPSEELFWDLVKTMKEPDPNGALDEDAVARLVDSKITAKLADNQKIEVETAEKDLVEARNYYAEACSRELGAAQEKYPLLQAIGVTVDDMQKFVIAHRGQTGRVPEPSETLEHFEQAFRSKLERTSYKRAEPPPAAPAPTVSASWTRDSRGQVAANGARQTLDEKRQALRDRLRAMR